MKKGTFASHAHVGAGALCHTVRTRGRLLFAEPPTCRRCRFYLLAPTLGRDGALAKMAAEDAPAPTDNRTKER